MLFKNGDKESAHIQNLPPTPVTFTLNVHRLYFVCRKLYEKGDGDRLRKLFITR